MGDELVRLGALDPNIHNTTKGGYLGRMYLLFMTLPNDKGQVSTTGGTGAKASLMEYLKKKIVKEDDADLKELYGFISDPAIRTANTIAKVGRDIGIFRFMENINAFSQMQGEDPWVFPEDNQKVELTLPDDDGGRRLIKKHFSLPDALAELADLEKRVDTHGFQDQE